MWDVGSFNEVVVMDVLKALRSMVRRFQETVGMAMCLRVAYAGNSSDIYGRRRRGEG